MANYCYLTNNTIDSTMWSEEPDLAINNLSNERISAKNPLVSCILKKAVDKIIPNNLLIQHIHESFSLASDLSVLPQLQVVPIKSSEILITALLTGAVHRVNGSRFFNTLEADSDEEDMILRVEAPQPIPLPQKLTTVSSDSLPLYSDMSYFENLNEEHTVDLEYRLIDNDMLALSKNFNMSCPWMADDIVINQDASGLSFNLNRSRSPSPLFEDDAEDDRQPWDGLPLVSHMMIDTPLWMASSPSSHHSDSPQCLSELSSHLDLTRSGMNEPEVVPVSDFFSMKITSDCSPGIESFALVISSSPADSNITNGEANFPLDSKRDNLNTPRQFGDILIGSSNYQQLSGPDKVAALRAEKIRLKKERLRIESLRAEKNLVKEREDQVMKEKLYVARRIERKCAIEDRIRRQQELAILRKEERNRLFATQKAFDANLADDLDISPEVLSKSTSTFGFPPLTARYASATKIPQTPHAIKGDSFTTVYLQELNSKLAAKMREVRELEDKIAAAHRLHEKTQIRKVDDSSAAEDVIWPPSFQSGSLWKTALLSDSNMSCKLPPMANPLKNSSSFGALFGNNPVSSKARWYSSAQNGSALNASLPSLSVQAISINTDLKCSKSNSRMSASTPWLQSTKSNDLLSNNHNALNSNIRPDVPSLRFPYSTKSDYAYDTSSDGDDSPTASAATAADVDDHNNVTSCQQLIIVAATASPPSSVDRDNSSCNSDVGLDRDCDSDNSVGVSPSNDEILNGDMVNDSAHCLSTPEFDMDVSLNYGSISPSSPRKQAARRRPCNTVVASSCINQGTADEEGDGNEYPVLFGID